jgi:subtilisin family serine protease
VLRAIDDAVADGMDIVNLSLGTFPSPSTGLYTSVIDRANAAGVLVVAAAGNSGPEPGTIGAPAGVPGAITVGNAANDRDFASVLRVEGAAPVIAVPSSNSTGRAALSGALRDVAELDPTGMACGALPTDSLNGRVALIISGVCLFTRTRTGQTRESCPLTRPAFRRP